MDLQTVASVTTTGKFRSKGLIFTVWCFVVTWIYKKKKKNSNDNEQQRTWMSEGHL